MSKLYDVIGTAEAGNLLADPNGADVIAVPLHPGKGVLKRGTLLFRESSGMYAAAENGDVTTSKYLVVLKETVDTGAAGAGVAEDAGAYRAGRFVDGEVKLKGGSALSAANKVVLKLQGIVFDVDDSASTFDNSTFKITYKANNSADPAEADYVVVEAVGDTHTVLANTVTGFTAPDGKTFSKWNTKADGTGTDRAAAATFTVSADVDLYAVWAS